MSHTVLTSTQVGAENIVRGVRTYVGSDYLTSYLCPTAAATFISSASFYEKGSDGNVVIKTIGIDNTISDTATSEVYADSNYSNPFSGLSLSLTEDEAYTFTEDQTSLAQKINYQVSHFISGSLTPSETTFTYKKEGLSYKSTIVSGDYGLILESTLMPITAEEKIEKYEETEDSAAIDTLLSTFKANNYTATVKVDNSLVKTYYVNSEDIYIQDNTASTESGVGYFKTETGHQSVSVSDSTVSEGSTSTTDFSTLHASFNLCGAVLEKQSDNTYAKSNLVTGYITDAFGTVGLSDYYNTYNTRIAFGEGSVTITSTKENVNYEVTFSNAGSTKLPLDIRNFNTVDTWEQALPDFASGLKTAFGDDFNLPYWDTGSEWVEYEMDAESGYFDIICEGISEEDASASVDSYRSTLLAAGFVEYTAEELEALGFDEYSYMGGGSEASDYVFKIDGTHYLEIYNNYDAGMTGVDLYIDAF